MAVAVKDIINESDRRLKKDKEGKAGEAGKAGNNTVNSSDSRFGCKPSVNSISQEKKNSQLDTSRITYHNLRIGFDKLRQDFGGRVDYIVNLLVNDLEAPDQIQFYRFVVKNNPIDVVLESLAITLDAVRDGVIPDDVKARYFFGVLRNKGLILSRRDLLNLEM